ncbi:MAG: hypothetical protein IT384_04910 [Deltaproteobacteria bacterium]|nr:hypothetical protein [Deltaproteobacteria bacterium]
MRALLPGVHAWAHFSEEKQLDFNGLYLQLPGGTVLVDPPALPARDLAQIEALGRPSLILLTNKDHRRAAPEARARFGAPIAIHRRDAPLVDCSIDRTFEDDELLAGALEVISIPNGKSPGESALYWHERRVLILGDALIGRPAGALSLLPPEKYASVEKARQGLERLRSLAVDAVLVGDGVSILERGAERLAAFFEG